MTTFRELKISSQLLNTIEKLGYTTPTEIQEKSIPYIVSGEDVIGESSTGSGKTLAFACGIIEHTVPKKGLQALILTPTRELAEQVKNDILKLSNNKNLQIASIYGGVAIGPQISSLQRAEVVIATPGRLLDHLERRTIDTSRIKILVLDEADRMLDMGFIRDVKEIMRMCPGKKQIMFFSATISREIESLSRQYMHNPHLVSAANQVDPTKLKQVFYDVPKNKKLSLLAHLLTEEKSKLALVFCNTQRNTEFVSRHLKMNGIDAIAIHGGLTQDKRTRTMNMFKEGRVTVLVCTDVAARGLHIPDVSHVYNYDLPRNPVDYVHRIGRTARVGEEGKVINLLCELDYDNFRAVSRKYGNFLISSMQLPEMKQLPVIEVNFKDESQRRNRQEPYRKQRYGSQEHREGGRSFGNRSSGGFRGFGHRSSSGGHRGGSSYGRSSGRSSGSGYGRSSKPNRRRY